MCNTTYTTCKNAALKKAIKVKKSYPALFHVEQLHKNKPDDLWNNDTASSKIIILSSVIENYRRLSMCVRYIRVTNLYAGTV